MLLLSAAALVAAACVPSFTILVAVLGLVGLSTVSAQLLSPLASELADPAQRGRVVGAVVSGGLIGILLVGLAGLAGALAARRAGTLHDRGWSVPATGAALLVLLLSLGAAALGAR